ncbi:poly(A) polymerase [Natronocella acetinitrilica]|uniref:Poly(A) polymerase I n=1 Tax=Natronocella acetinitrilica TaxID=414046 RepID=A0AAE3G392_9GAMM|nr:polynucleotide adenylyltransferase PcnB [Natronocella acetinitrilica]MCP1675001.1 poly(A) polymerase [Natronocella acetinitrilica]
MAQARYPVTEQTSSERLPQPVIFQRSEHRISRAEISDNALKVLYRLNKAGYEAYLVGGGVRDLSLGREPKDFDVATNAKPEEVRALFRNCRLIGRRFRLAHVHFGPEIIEVATFRAAHDGNGEAEGEGEMRDGMLVRDNVYGTVEEDALRRDFTVNSLYYNIADFSVVDFAHGMDDLEAGLIRLIGDAEERYREDPVRMLRAVRFAAKLGFRVEDDAARPIPELAGLLENVPQARLFEEVLKLLMGGQGAQTFDALRYHGLFGALFPATEAQLQIDEHGTWVQFINAALENTDQRIADGKPVTPAFLFAAILWPVVTARVARSVEEEGLNEAQALQNATADVLQQQVQRVAIPKRFSLPMREIFLMQPRLLRFRGRRAGRLAAHPRFRAAYDFLLLRARVGDAPQDLADWWTEYQQQDEGAAAVASAPTGPRRRRRRRRRNGGGGGGEGGQ